MNGATIKMGLNVFLCVFDGVCPYACPRAAVRLNKHHDVKEILVNLSASSKFG